MTHTPRRLIRTFDATMLVIGSMIGSGIFIVSADSARHVGTGPRLLAVWSVAGLLTVIASISCAELATMYPEAGGPYVYLTKAFGPVWGFLYGWSLVTVVQTGTIAAVAIAFARFLSVLVPLGGEAFEKTVAVALIAVLTAANARGLKTGTRIQNVLTVVKGAALVGLTVGCLLTARRATPAVAATVESAATAVTTAPSAAAPANVMPSVAAATALPFALLPFALAMAGPLFSQSAWTNVTFPGAEVAEPSRTFPRALVGGCALVASLYVLANVGYLQVLGFDGIAGAPMKRVGTAAAEALLPGLGAALMASAILISTSGCVNGLILSGGRILYALAQDVRFLDVAARLNNRDVPGIALLLQAVWASLLVLSGGYSELIRYVLSAELILSILLVLAVPALRRKEPDLPRGYRTWGYPLTPWLYAIPATALAALLLVGSPKTNGPGLLIVLSGLPVYFLTKRRA